MASQHFFHVWIDFKTKKETSWRPFIGGSPLKDKCSQSYSVCLLKQKEERIVAILFNISEKPMQNEYFYKI